MKELILIFLKFCVVGGSGFVIDFGLTYLCKEKLHFNKYVANTIGFIVAASSNYVFNRIWTFTSDNPNIQAEYITFIIVSVIGLLINSAALWVIHDKMKYNFYISKVGATAVAMIWNFLANYLFTFA